MSSVQMIVDDLRKLSEKMSRSDSEELRFIEKQSHMIGEIFGVYPPYCKKKMAGKSRRNESGEKKKQTQTNLPANPSLPANEVMSFEEKRRLYEAKFPNCVSAGKRARARELLNFIANNQALFTYSDESLSKAKEAFNMISSHSWNSVADSESVEGELIRGDTGKDADFSEAWKFGSHENFSKLTYDAAFSNTTQSQSTVLDETSTMITSYDPDLATPVQTCNP